MKKRLYIRAAILIVVTGALLFLWLWMRGPQADVQIVWALKKQYVKMHFDPDFGLLVAVEEQAGANHRLVRLDSGSGRTLWDIPLPANGNMYTFAASGQDIFASGLGAVYRFNPSDGSVLWKTDVVWETDVWGGRLYAEIIPGSPSDSLLIQHENTVYQLSRSNGAVLWQKDVGRVTCHPLREVIAIVDWSEEGHSGSLSALRSSDGTPAWGMAIPLSRPGVRSLPGSQIAVYSSPGTLTCLDLLTGKEKWSIQGAKGGEYVEGDLLVYVTVSDTLALADVTTGQDQSKLVPNAASSLISATEDRLYFTVGRWGRERLALCCTERESGKVLWQTKPPLMLDVVGLMPLGIPVVYPNRVEERKGWILVLTEVDTGHGMRGAVHYREDAYRQDGALLWTARLPGRPILRNGTHLLCEAHPMLTDKPEEPGLFLVEIKELAKE